MLLLYFLCYQNPWDFLKSIFHVSPRIQLYFPDHNNLTSALRLTTNTKGHANVLKLPPRYFLMSTNQLAVLLTECWIANHNFLKHHFEFRIHRKLIPKLAYPIIAELVSLLVLLYIIFNTVTVEDGSEIFYQVDRSAFTAGLNGAANPRSIPDIINSSSGTLSEYLYLSCVVAISAQLMFRFKINPELFRGSSNMKITVKCSQIALVPSHSKWITWSFCSTSLLYTHAYVVFRVLSRIIGGSVIFAEISPLA